MTKVKNIKDAGRARYLTSVSFRPLSDLCGSPHIFHSSFLLLASCSLCRSTLDEETVHTHTVENPLSTMKFSLSASLLALTWSSIATHAVFAQEDAPRELSEEDESFWGRFWAATTTRVFRLRLLRHLPRHPRVVPAWWKSPWIASPPVVSRAISSSPLRRSVSPMRIFEPWCSATRTVPAQRATTNSPIPTATVMKFAWIALHSWKRPS